MNAPEVNHTRLRGREDLWGYCRECYYGDICKGGCTWTSHCTLGRSGNNPYCIHRALTFEEQGKREHLVQVEAAPGMPFDHGVFGLEVHDVPEEELTPTILGHSLERILELDWREESIWSEDELKAFIKRAPRLYGISS